MQFFILICWANRLLFIIYNITMERTNKWERSPNSGVGRNPRFLATAMDGAAATRDCKLGVCCSDITSAGIVSPASGVDVVRILTRTENGAREVITAIFVGIENLLKLKGREDRTCVWDNIGNLMQRLRLWKFLLLCNLLVNWVILDCNRTNY